MYNLILRTLKQAQDYKEIKVVKSYYAIRKHLSKITTKSRANDQTNTPSWCYLKYIEFYLFIDSQLSINNPNNQFKGYTHTIANPKAWCSLRQTSVQYA